MNTEMPHKLYHTYEGSAGTEKTEKRRQKQREKRDRLVIYRQGDTVRDTETQRDTK